MIYNIICETLVISSEDTCELFPEPKWKIQVLKKRLSQKEGEYFFLGGGAYLTHAKRFQK